MNIQNTLCCVILVGAGCAGPDNAFTKLSDPIPPEQDTSAPPAEPVEEPAIPEVPPACPDRLYPAVLTQIDESCRFEPPVVTYTPVVEWNISSFDEFSHLTEQQSAPVVGQFTDDNADGVVDADDVPDIVTVSNSLLSTDVALRMISGDGTVVHWSRQIWVVDGQDMTAIAASTPAIGDVDLDGEPEIVLLLAPLTTPDGGMVTAGNGNSSQPECMVARLDATGAIEAVNTDALVRCRAHSPAIADVQGDGVPDIVVPWTTYAGTDLSVVGTSDYTLPVTYGIGYGLSASYWTGGIPVPVDLDGDGLMETVTGAHIQEWDGTWRCATGISDGWPGVADLDGDGDAEIVSTGNNTIEIFDHNCQFIYGWELMDYGRGGPPTIADFDGDGIPEIGLPGGSNYMVYETDGTLNFATPASDGSSNCTGSSVFDFEEDGYAEVVYADEVNLWIISGHSGDYVMRWTGHSSWTGNEYPTIVDVDGDGEAEIVTVGSSGVSVIAALEGWAPARQVWNQHAYWITNVNDDLTIPSPTPQNWPEYNSFRSGDLRVNAGQGAKYVDAKPFVHDICEVECGEGTVQVALSPNNEGLADAIDGVNLAVYAEQTDGSRVLIEALSAEDLHRAGYTTEGIVLELAMTDLPTGTLILVADDDGTGMGVIEECDEDNNELRLEGLCADE